MKNLFKLKKSTDSSSSCAAMRCTEGDLTSLPGDPWGLQTVQLCQRHAALAIEFARQESSSEGVSEATALVVRGFASEGTEVLEVARAYSIDNHFDLVQVGEWLQMVKARRDELEDREKEITQPINQALQKVRDLFRPAKQFWADAEVILKGKIGAAKLLEETRNRKALKEAAEAHAAEDASAVVAAIAKVTTTADLKGITTFTKWKYILEDEAKFMREAPDQYKMPNERMLREHCAHSTDRSPAPIPGVKFIPDVQVSARAAS